MAGGRKSYQAIDERRSKLPEMVMRGMDTTEIAKALGVCAQTARSDLKDAGFVFRRGNGSGKWVPASLSAKHHAGDNREWSAFDSMNGYWCCPCDSRRDAMAEADHPSEVGRVEWFWPHVDAIQVIEQMQCSAIDFAGEYGEEWLDDLRCGDPEVLELEAMLQDAVDRWMKKTNRMPRLFAVHDVEEVQDGR